MEEVVSKVLLFPEFSNYQDAYREKKNITIDFIHLFASYWQ